MQQGSGIKPGLVLLLRKKGEREELQMELELKPPERSFSSLIMIFFSVLTELEALSDDYSDYSVS